ncbi:MAG: right-handed parallel beta-helix repeat-containing protein [Pirellulales bacterium]|nr:right-handed parallel beta-helix repeat-containing protein [Pirellulales bacterium]
MSKTSRVLASSVFLGLTIFGYLVARADEIQRNGQAIREVLSGKCRVAHAAWWGFSAEESTQSLQSAINSGAEKVIVEKMPGPWIVDKIELANDQELFFEPGVVVLAKKGAFRGTADSLLTAWNKKNIKLTGPGATLRMHRADYDSPAYKKAEWRHVLSLRGCDQVIVAGLTLAESGGDGIYLGTGRNGEPNRHVTIRDVICDRNYRQGISVISAENLLIENCTLTNTAGTAPAAGIDFEPNHPRERLVHCVMRNCTIENNQGYAIHIYARPLDGTSVPVSMRIENCVTRGTNALSASVITSCGPTGPLKGEIEFVDCRFEDSGHTGLQIGSKPPTGVKLRFVHCTLADPSDKPVPTAPIRFSTHQGDLEPTGGVEFADCTIRERVDRPVMKYDDALGSNLLGITGTLTIERGGRKTMHKLDQDLVGKWIPFDSVLTVRPVALDKIRLEPVAAVSPAERTLPAHRVRGEARYLVSAAAGDTVRLRLKHQAVGRQEGKPVPVQVLAPSGKEIHRVSIDLGQEADCTFSAAETGVFTVLGRPDRHTLQILSSTHPVSIAGSQGAIHLIYTRGDFPFWVPPEVREFGIRIKGEGDGERVSAAIHDAAGAKRLEQADISDAKSLHVKRDPATRGEAWRLGLAKPGAGVLEDVYVEFRGIPAILGFDPQCLLRPAKTP